VVAEKEIKDSKRKPKDRKMAIYIFLIDPKYFFKVKVDQFLKLKRFLK
jgi:hypothetical protein